jgi:SAM-dependent methyltransferase
MSSVSDAADERAGSAGGAPACAACGAVAREEPDHGWEFFGRTWKLVRCGACGSSRTDPLPDDATLAQLYSGSFDYGWYRHHYPAKLADAALRLAELRAAGVALGPRLLDFGGGVGYFSRAARLLGIDAQTWDPMLAAGSPPPQGAFDTVVALHVIEHANRIDETVARLRSFVRPGGSAIVVVPNAGGEGYRARGAGWVWAQPPLIHVHHLTEPGLRALLGRHGLEIERVTFHDRWDANGMSDLVLSRWFGRLDAEWGRRRRLRPLVAARNSLLRYAALAAAAARRTRPEDRAEIAIVARAVEGARP